MERHEIVQLLGPWSERKGPRYERLAAAFERIIRSGELPAQTRLPAERWLAQRLGVSRSTVVAAYALLQDKGWVISRQGSGTEVSTQSPQRSSQLRRQQLKPLARGPVIDAYLSNELVAVDLSAGAPAWPTGFDQTVCAILPEQIAPLLDEYGYIPLGLPQLRQAVADNYTWNGLRTKPEQILITSGAQQAISLLATLLVQRGDTVIMENPTFFGAIDAFRAAGARLATVPIDDGGFDFPRLRELLSERAAQCLYLIPTHHNPTGNTLSEMQRREIVTLAQAANIPLIEDLTLGFNALDREPPPPMAGYGQEGSVITIGSLSKIFWAGLRVGWVRGSESLIERLARLKVITDLGSSLISQLLAVQLMPHLEQVIELRRQELTPRRDFLLETLSRKAPSWCWKCPQGGLFVWVQLPQGDARDLAQEALHNGVIVTPGTTLSVDGSHTAWLRLPFLLPLDHLQVGLDRLIAAWERYERKIDANC